MKMEKKGFIAQSLSSEGGEDPKLWKQAVEETERARKAQREKLQHFQDQLHRKDEELQRLLATFERYKQNQRRQMDVVKEQEGFLKGQVLRLEEEAQHLRAATASLMAELEGEGSQGLDSQSQVPLEKSGSSPWYVGEDMAELRAFLEAGELQARKHLASLQQSLMALLAKEESNNQEKEEILRQLQEHRDTVLHLLVNKLEDFQSPRSELPREGLKEQSTSLQDEPGAKEAQDMNRTKDAEVLFHSESQAQSKPSFVPDELLPLRWEVALDPSRNKACQTSFVIENAKGSGGVVAALQAEQESDLGSFGGMKGSQALMSTVDNLNELLEEIKISYGAQSSSGVSTSDPKRVLFFFCGPSSGNLNDDHLFFDQLIFSRAMPEPQNKESFPFLEKSMIPLLMPMVIPSAPGSLAVLEDSFQEELPQSHVSHELQSVHVSQIPEEPSWNPKETQTIIDEPQSLLKSDISIKDSSMPEETFDQSVGATELELEEDKQEKWFKNQDIVPQNGINKKEHLDLDLSNASILDHGVKCPESCENAILVTDIENSQYLIKINELEKEVEKHFQGIVALEEENESYRQKIKQLKEENWRYSHHLKSLDVEENVGTPTASADADGGTAVDSSEILEGRDEKDVSESVKLKKGKDIRTICAPEMKNETHSTNLPDVNEVILNSQLATWTDDLNRFPLKREAQENTKARFFQLISDLHKERNQVFLKMTTLHRAQEICNNKTYALEEEKEINLKRITKLEKDKNILIENLTQLRNELDLYLHLVSDLEECNGKNYEKISDLEEENMILKKKVHTIQKAMAKNIREAREMTEQVTQENQELKALIADLGNGYKDLIEDLVPGIQDVMQSLKEENEQLLHKIDVREEKAMGETKDIERITKDSKQNEKLKEQIQKLLAKANMVEQGIQVTESSDRPTRDERSHLEEASFFAKGQKQLPMYGEKYQLHMHNTRMSSFLVRKNPEISSDTQEPTNECEQKRADLKKNKKGKCSSEFHNQAHNSLASSSQLQDTKTMIPKRESKSNNKLLHHQILTLKSQLRDQAVLHSELQTSQNETRYLQGQLTEKIEELKRRKNEVNSAVTPLRAKVASLVQKCRDRNNLVAQLLQELHRHGIENLKLSETARALVDDVAVATYASTFMSSEPREPCHQSDAMSEDIALGKDQTCLLSPDMANPLGYFSSDTSPAADSDPLLWKTHTGSPNLPSGVMNNPRTCQTGMDVGVGLISESIQQETQEICSLSTPPTNDLPLPSKVMSPERILALHWELSHSRYNNYQNLASPSESALSGSMTQPSLVEHTRTCFSEPLAGSSFEEHQGQEQGCKRGYQPSSETKNQHSGTEHWGSSPRNTIMNNTWTSGDQPDGSTSKTTAKSHLSNGLSASNKGLIPLGKDSDVLERARSLTIKQEAPAPVGSLSIIKTVGKRCLMIGWERPLVDELGCSNGTFVEGYRIYIDGKFHKYLVSSACTKTLLENLDLSVPFSISVQTEGTGGLVSEKVHIVFNHWANKGTSSSGSSISPDKQDRGSSFPEERRRHINKAHKP
uniref:Coiled-coil domain-containing protein 18-like n=1 Tax=Monodelphis domestica TaxID=13616 RepID=A0A5F8H0R4_MONDO